MTHGERQVTGPPILKQRTDPGVSTYLADRTLKTCTTQSGTPTFTQ